MEKYVCEIRPKEEEEEQFCLIIIIAIAANARHETQTGASSEPLRDGGWFRTHTRDTKR